MFEQLLASGRGGMYFPNSGPGSKYLLAGSTELGYFGLVSDEEMGAMAEVMTSTLQQHASKTLFSYGNIQWLKMFFKGTVYFVPDAPLAIGLKMYELIEAGMFRGDDGTFTWSGSTTPPRPINNVIQNKRLYVKEEDRTWVFKTRLPDAGRAAVANSVLANTEAGILVNTLAGGGRNPVQANSLFKGVRKVQHYSLWLLSDAGNEYKDVAPGAPTGTGFSIYYTNASTTPRPDDATKSLISYSNNSLDFEIPNYKPFLILESVAGEDQTYALPVTGVSATSNSQLVGQNITSAQASANLTELLQVRTDTTSDTLGPQELGFSLESNPTLVNVHDVVERAPEASPKLDDAVVLPIAILQLTGSSNESSPAVVDDSALTPHQKSPLTSGASFISSVELPFPVEYPVHVQTITTTYSTPKLTISKA